MISAPEIRFDVQFALLYLVLELDIYCFLPLNCQVISITASKQTEMTKKSVEALVK